MLYNAQHLNLAEAWVAAFTQSTGIKVEIRSGRDPELAHQIVQECSAPPADVEAVILPAEVRDGVAAWALVLPEQSALRASETAAGTPATVLDVRYFGHGELVRLALADGLIVTARPAGFAAPKVGQQVRLVVEGPVHAFGVASASSGEPGRRLPSANPGCGYRVWPVVSTAAAVVASNESRYVLW